jgi:serine/threonine protein kinase
VLHQIGAGVLGPVFRAYDPERDRLVAVKLFRLDVTPERVHQFAAELDAITDARWNAPAVAVPFAAGISGVSAYLGQEFFAADSLDLVCRESGRMAPERVVRIAGTLAEALDEAATRGMCHGALHPRDVLVSGDELKLTGLGIARALERVGVTPPLRRPYVAPERLAGRPWDRQADVFSLAVLTWEMFLGKRLAGAGTEAVAQLSDLEADEVDVAGLERVFRSAFADEPARRPSTSIAFVDAIQDGIAGRTVTAPARRRQERAAPTRERNSTASEPDTAMSNLPRLPLDDGSDDKSESLLSDEESLVMREPVVVPDEEAIEIERFENIAAVGDYDIRVDPPAEIQANPPIEPRSDISGASDERVESHPIEAAESPEIASQIEPEIQPEIEPAIEPEIEPAIEARNDTLAAPHEAEAPEPLTSPAAAAHQAEMRPASMGLMPLALALVLGLAMGFAGGYAVAYKARPAETALVDAMDLAAPPATAGVGIVGDSVSSSSARVPTPPAVTPAAAPVSVPVARPAPAPRGHVLVRSTPSGATVTIDGRNAGRTPMTLRDLEYGTHTLRIERDGYAASERRVVLSKTKPSSSIAATLTRAKKPAPAATPRSTKAEPKPAAAAPTSGTLSVDSRPVGATVYVDGRVVGTTPLSIDHLAPGEHAVRLERAGNQQWSSSVRIVAGEKNRVAASLENRE